MNRPRRQRGVAVLAVVGMVLLIGAYFVLGSLNFASQRVARDTVTNDALLKAKQALIAYAAADTTRPGELPCPDVNDDGKLVLNEDFVGSNCVSLIGRLPWSSLGLPDLRDEAGERLWYALSDDFHANGSVPLNSDTAFRPGNVSLSISGLQPATNLVAVVFSPGTPLARQGAATVQNRSCTVGVNCDADRKCTTVPATNTPKCNPVNYLDVSGVEDNSDGNRQFIAAAASSTFNDRLMPIHSDDIMWLVEKRAGRELAQHLRQHYTNWETFAAPGFYPWAAPLSDPTTIAAGVNGTTNGQLPLSPASVVWSSANASLGGCAGVGTTQIQCTATSVLTLLAINGRVSNVGTAFVDPPDASNVSVTGVVLGQNVTWTLNRPAQALDFTWSATLLGLATVTVEAPRPSAWTTGSWLVTNNWHENALYALSAGHAVNGTGSCTAGTTCLTVANTAAPNNDKHAVVIMTGRALPLAVPAQANRPAAAPAPATQFLENGNATLADGVLEHNAKSTSFNDFPVVVRP